MVSTLSRFLAIIRFNQILSGFQTSPSHASELINLVSFAINMFNKRNFLQDILIAFHSKCRSFFPHSILPFRFMDRRSI